MATLRNYILPIAGLFLLTRCNNENASKGTLPVSFHPPLARTQNSLAGEWKYNNSIYYSSKLKLNPDGTFDYHNETCYGQGVTKGKWKESNGTIMLASDDTYRPFEKANPQKMSKETWMKEGVLTVIGFDETDMPKFLGPNDTIRVYFDNVLLNLKGDTLYSASNNKYIAKHKFNRVLDNR